MGEGGGREDADKIKSIKWKGFSRAFLSGESKAATTSAMGLPGFWGRGDAGLGSSIPRSRVKWEGTSLLSLGPLTSGPSHSKKLTPTN